MTDHTMSPEEIDRLACKRAGAKLGWYTHAALYVAVNLFLFAISHHAFGTGRWSVAPLLGWGLGLVLHGVAVFVLGAGSGLRARLEQKEREKLQREHRGG